jgi:hypothetical protein
MIFMSTSFAEPIQCHQCEPANPCVAVLEFKDVKFSHNVYCRIDKEGRERWSSEDDETLELYYDLRKMPGKGEGGNELNI